MERNSMLMRSGMPGTKSVGLLSRKGLREKDFHVEPINVDGYVVSMLMKNDYLWRRSTNSWVNELLKIVALSLNLKRVEI